MNTLVPYFFKPISDFWLSLTEDQDFKETLFLKGGTTGGNEWHSKYLNRERQRINHKYDEYQRRFNSEPELLDVLNDNKWRLTILAGFERLFAFRQAQGFLKTRFNVSNSNTNVLGLFFNQGLFKGYFRGYAATLAQFVAVQYHALQYSYGSNFFTHFVASSLLEAATFPLDTLRTVLQADVQGVYKGYTDVLGRILENQGYSHLYRGFTLKILYNAAFLFNLRNMYDQSNLMYLSFPLWVLSYPLLTVKSRLQVCDTPLSFQKLTDIKSTYVSIFKGASLRCIYAGVVPFVFINTAFQYNFYGLYSKSAQERVLHELTHEAKEFANPARY